MTSEASSLLSATSNTPLTSAATSDPAFIEGLKSILEPYYARGASQEEIQEVTARAEAFYVQSAPRPRLRHHQPLPLPRRPPRTPLLTLSPSLLSPLSSLRALPYPASKTSQTNSRRAHQARARSTSGGSRSRGRRLRRARAVR
ncbi:hypothetical protein BCR35DRAFT_192378 [Leucosporidium creatinivorum]|uniref:Uncharacterized protein n=1 Tax=Leucosporidium creatinivorum TaxID=106004 RepID=A0A1Y2G2I0_9BASI|nr:hypothetical protein BCR35DRAFT_192378 [Leucosporidium creatinivorum]